MANCNTPETLASFVWVEDSPTLTADRSTLERHATCPAQARFVECGLVNDASQIADTGEAVHQAYGAGVRAYIDLANEGEVMRAGMLADIIRTELRQARPDIQPDAIAAAGRSVWSFAQFIADVHPMNVLRYDGGEGEHSGQLAWDLDGLGVRVTSELDLLLATESKAVLREVDYKSGWRRWSVSEVAKSFQFQTHGWLVLQNYPEVECLEVQVWDTRRNDVTYPVAFERCDLPNWHARIASAAGYFYQHRNTLPADAPVWPAADKCPTCPAAALCPASREAAVLYKNPARYVDLMFAIQRRLDRMTELATAAVDIGGEDLIGSDGARFGVGKPKSERKPTKSLYVLKPTKEDE